MTRIVLAEDHTLVRKGMRLLIETIPGLTVVGEAADGLEALRLIEQHLPDCVLMDHQALAAGAAGYLLKGSDKEELEIAVRAVCSGETYLTPAISKTLVTALSRKSQASSASSPLELLTLRQREVLRLVAEGSTTKQVAARLGLSVKTVEAHRGAIMERLGIRDLAGLVRFAIRAGLVAGDK